MDILGHSQITLTLNTYSRVTPAPRSDAATRMDDVLAPAPATNAVQTPGTRRARMQLELTNHARQRMAQRGISEADVHSIIEHPQQTRRSRKDPSCSLVTGLAADGRRRIVVTVATGSRPLRIVSVR